MQQPHCCPICNDFSVKTTLQQYSVTAKVKGEERDVSALAAFMCQNGHVFFLRKTDLTGEGSAQSFVQAV